MMFGSALQRFCLLLTLSATATLAQSRASGGSCDWRCSIGERVSALEKQIAELNALLNIQASTVGQSLPTKTFGTGASTSHFTSTSSSRPNSNRPGTSATTAINSKLPTPTLNPSASAAPISPSRHGYRSIAYFGNWDIYGRKFFPQNIPADKLTHILYSFGDNKQDGSVFFSDPWADTDIHYPGDSWSESGNNVYGAVKQFNVLKKANRNLKFILSIGGWSYTNTKKHMDEPASTEEGRKAFADSCVKMIKNYGFDGIDIDWEYPQSEEQGTQLLALLQAVRKATDAYADTLVAKTTHRGTRQQRPHFELSIAAPAGKDNYRRLPLKDIAGVLDYINLMAYDFTGSWENVTGHTANLYASRSNPKSTPYNTVDVVDAYLHAGVPASKLNLGMPLYGRAFANTTGPGEPYSGLGSGTWEAGVYDWKELPLRGAKVYYDSEAGATYSYDNSTGMMVSFDTVGMALRKAEYIKKTGLGGAMWWEVSGDRLDDTGIISNVVKALDGSHGRGMEYKPNWVDYSDSEFKNLADGFAG